MFFARMELSVMKGMRREVNNDDIILVIIILKSYRSVCLVFERARAPRPPLRSHYEEVLSST